MRAPHIFQTVNGGEFTINLLNTTLRNGGYMYILLIVNIFSHYVESIPLKDQTATSIVNAFMEGWAYRGHGVPNIMLTDQGKNVDGLAVHELCHDLGITKRHTRVARGSQFVTAARLATKLFGPQEARINIFGPLCKLLTIERHLGNPFMGVRFCKHK